MITLTAHRESGSQNSEQLPPRHSVLGSTSRQVIKEALVPETLSISLFLPRLFSTFNQTHKPTTLTVDHKIQRPLLTSKTSYSTSTMQFSALVLLVAATIFALAFASPVNIIARQGACSGDQVPNCCDSVGPASAGSNLPIGTLIGNGCNQLAGTSYPLSKQIFHM